MHTTFRVRQYQRSLCLLLTALGGLLFCLDGTAQISTDGTMGPPAQILTGPDYTIGQNLGQRSGANLFHSFKDFNINTGQSATFTGAADLQRVISRVTGGNQSNIDGLLKSEIPSADFYFVNPSGFMFGPAASVNISGSLHISTANYFKFGDTRFDAQPIETKVLSAEAPTAFGFLDAEIGTVTFDQSQIVLGEDESLSVIGGHFQMKGGEIEGASGEVSVVSLGSSGEVIDNSSPQDPEFEPDAFSSLGGIDISENSTITLKDGGGVNMVGKDMKLTDSVISSQTIDDIKGGDIELKLTGVLEILDGGQILTTTYDSGDGGNIRVFADQILIDGSNSDTFTGFSTHSRANFISDLNVTLDITHTFTSDLVVSLSSPDNEGVNLVSGAGGDGDNFMGTTFDDEAETSVQLASAPFQDSYKPLENLSNFDGLSLNGTWILEMNDLGEGDDGTLNSWSMVLESPVTGKMVFESTDIPQKIDDTANTLSSIPIAISKGNGGGKGGDIFVSANSTELVSGQLVALSEAGGSSGGITLSANESVSIRENSLIKIESTNSNGGDIEVSAGSTVKLNNIDINTNLGGNGGHIRLTAGENLQRFSADVRAEVEGDGGTILIEPRPVGSVILDGSFGFDGPLVGPNFIVSEDMGFSSGGNLFHSFRDFSLMSEEAVSFTGKDSIDNILARVTGGTPSLIDGSIGSSIPEVNLFFINPYGLVFGAGAQLDVDGAVTITTADFIRLGEPGRFDALNPENSLLTLDTPSAFGFLNEIPTGVAIDRSQLSLNAGITLSIISDDILISSGTVKVLGGAVNMISVESQGEVKIIHPDPGPVEFDVENVNDFGDINLTDGSEINVDGEGGGAVTFLGENLTLDRSLIRSKTHGAIKGKDIGIELTGSLNILGGAQVLSSTEGMGDGGNIRINARSILLDSREIAVTEVATETMMEDGGGKGGDISIEIADLQVVNGGRIMTRTSGSGDGGNLKVTAETIDLGQKSSQFRAGITSVTMMEDGGGKGGDVSIETRDLQLVNGGFISSITSGNGDGGTLSILAKIVKVDGQNSQFETGIEARTMLAIGGGNGGDISLTTKDLQVVNSGTIDASTRGSGDGGTLTVTAETVFVDGQNAQFAGIFAETGFGNAETGFGNGGDISIESTNLRLVNGGVINAVTFGNGNAGAISIESVDIQLVNGGRINASTRGSGNAGILMVTAESAFVDGQNLPLGTGIIAQTQMVDKGGGKGGNITITIKDLELVNGGVIGASTFGSGDAGKLEISAETIFVDNQNSSILTGISAGTNLPDGGGDGGEIRIVTKELAMVNGGTINTSTEGSGDGGRLEITAEAVFVDAQNSQFFTGIESGTRLPEGGGNGGIVSIATKELKVINEGQISVTTFGSGDGGTFTISAETIFIDGQNSQLFGTGIGAGTEDNGVGKSGDINITTRELQLINGGTIDVSTSGSGKGGNLTISAESIFINGQNSQFLTGISARTGLNDGGGNGGDINILTESFEVVSGGIVEVTTLGDGNGGDLKVVADTIVLDGQGSSSPTAVLSQSRGIGDAGSLQIEARSLNVLDGAAIRAETLGNGFGGNIIIAADALEVDKKDSGLFTGIIALTELENVEVGGDAGRIDLDVNLLQIRNGGQISDSTTGSGNSGDIDLVAETVSIHGENSAIGAEPIGRLIVSESERLLFNEDLVGKAYINEMDEGVLPELLKQRFLEAGINLTENLEIEILSKGQAWRFISETRIFEVRDRDNSEAEKKNFSIFEILPAGEIDSELKKSGNITIDTTTLELIRGGKISTNTVVNRDSGTIAINADNILIDGGDNLIETGIFAETEDEQDNAGRGGDIKLSANRLDLINGGAISSSTSGSGDGGDIEINGGSVRIENTSFIATEALPLRLLNRTSGGLNGSSGEIFVKVKKLELDQNSQISTENNGNGETGGITLIQENELHLFDNSTISVRAVKSNAGTIQVQAKNLISRNGSSIIGDAAVDGGNISMRIEETLHLMGSKMTAESGNDGGNFLSNSKTFILDSSELNANAIDGNGGDINIVTEAFIQSPDSKIEADSERGQSGSIRITAPNVDLSAQLLGLTEDVLDADAWSVAHCTERHELGEVSSFIIIGCEGVAPAPDDLLPGLGLTGDEEGNWRNTGKF